MQAIDVILKEQMIPAITITNEDILRQIKLSCKIPDIVEQITKLKVIENTANEMAIKVETEELQQAADEIRRQKQLITADDTWKWLEKHSMTLEDFEYIVYTSVLSGKLTSYLFNDKAKSYFYENKLNYIGAAIYEVILDDEDLAWELFYSIKEGETSFNTVANQYVQDVELRRKGGYRGVLHRKDLKPEVSAAVLAAQSPQLIKPITTSKGVHLIFVEEIIEPQLNDSLKAQICVDLFYEWLKEQAVQFDLNLQIH